MLSHKLGRCQWICMRSFAVWFWGQNPLNHVWHLYYNLLLTILLHDRFTSPASFSLLSDKGIQTGKQGRKKNGNLGFCLFTQEGEIARHERDLFYHIMASNADTFLFPIPRGVVRPGEGKTAFCGSCLKGDKDLKRGLNIIMEWVALQRK